MTAGAERLQIAAATHTGLHRDQNEDAYRVYHEDPRVLSAARGSIVAVADGLGGHKAGEYASKLSVDQLFLYFQYPPARFHPHETLLELVRSINRTVYRTAQQPGAHHRMGSTLTAVHFDHALQRAFVVHVGDSRVYHWHPKPGLRRLTVDHTEEGHDSLLTNHIGRAESVEIDASSWKLHPGSRWLLCSDGLNLGVTDKEIAMVLGDAPEPADATNELIALANRTGRDNVTAIVVAVH